MGGLAAVRRHHAAGVMGRRRPLHNHYFLGSVAAWIHQRVGGVRQTAPGWAAFEIRPVVDDRVGWARISHRTVRGDLAVHWRHEDGHWRADLTVPAGATAALHLPGRPATSLPSGAHRLRFPLDAAPVSGA